MSEWDGRGERRAAPPPPRPPPRTLLPLDQQLQSSKGTGGGGPLHCPPGHPGWVLAGGWDGATWVILGISSSWSLPGVLLQRWGGRDRSLVSAPSPFPAALPRIKGKGL